MRLLLDECLPRKLKHLFIGHDAHTVPEEGWAGKKNGELLRLMTGRFDAFVTVDSNLYHQQNLVDFPLLIILLRAENNRYATLAPLIPHLLSALQAHPTDNPLIISGEPGSLPR